VAPFKKIEGARSSRDRYLSLRDFYRRAEGSMVSMVRAWGSIFIRKATSRRFRYRSVIVSKHQPSKAPSRPYAVHSIGFGPITKAHWPERTTLASILNINLIPHF
jgi:hypothetical protein